jgi:membrane peptidoglycan carboxypeptidase
LQEIAETAVENGAARNLGAFNATNASLVAIDHKTGQIVAMVGSKDYYDEEIDGNVNITTSFRQPGSSFKPYVYAEAFYNRYYPAAVVYDVKTQFGGGKPPNNYDGSFRGPMTMRAALAQSRNIPAIKAYFLAGEQEAIIRRTQTMGLEFLDPDRDYGWPLALGTGEIRLLDHVGAFGVFANSGRKMEKTAIIEIKNAKGESLEKFDENERGEEVLDEQIAYLITSILSDTGVRLGPTLTIPGQVNAAKTGTSNKKVGTINIPSNLLTLGYTYHITAGAWAGNSNDANSGNLYATANGYEGAGPIWKNFMVEAHKVKGWEYTEFPKPSGIITMSVSAATGKLPGAGTPPDGFRSDIFASFAIPSEVDNSFAKVLIDTRNNLLANNYCPDEFTEEKYFREHHAIVPTYENWESAVRAWAYGMAAKDDSQEVGAPPKETSPLCNKEHFEAKRTVKITEPSNYTKVEPGKVEVEVKTKSDFPIEKVVFYLDGSVQYLATQAPFTGYIRISHFLEDDSEHTVKVVLYDKYGYTAQSTIEVRVKGGAESSEEEDTDPETDSSEIIEEEETPVEDPLPTEETPDEDAVIPEEETQPESTDPPPFNGGN